MHKEPGGYEPAERSEDKNKDAVSLRGCITFVATIV